LTRFSLIIAAAITFGALSVACNDSDETIDTGNGDVTTSRELPDDFPDDFPIYPGAEIESAQTVDSDDAEGHVVTWQSDDDIDDIVAFYDEEFGDGSSWRQVTRVENEGATIYAVTSADESIAGSLSVTPENGNVAIQAIIGRESGDDGDPPAPDGGDGDSEEGGGDDDGSSGSGSLPDEQELSEDFPEDRVPLPDGIRVTSSTSIDSGETSTHVVQFYSAMSADDLRSHFRDELSAQGWTEAFVTEQHGEILAAYSDADSATPGAGVNVLIVESDVEGYRSVTVTVTE